ncbi:sodium-dependent transporter [Leucobacter sp. M11]|uniref:sodium-dependent transporter n=1 Tax=Leucobacter sp. M11 TaxID=2993565 RepID=UPI002D7F9F19|nr:sodium-dependent transporter [Leucobacter sp. M11]MEB4615300.1 sodium-dependent transporter [Leucobacter sp. M11]
MSASPTPGTRTRVRETFTSRRVFILSAIGSAVGLGNIWRFPYVAYENGAGAFIVPYLIALLTAGIPLLFLDYAIGHRYRGSAPLSYRRLGRRAEALGWWQVAICFVIAIYYAVIIAWAIMYTFFSTTLQWGNDPEAFFLGDFLNLTGESGLVLEYVPAVLVPLIIVWVLCLGISFAGVRKGVGMANLIFLPLLVIMFVILCVQSLFLPGAMDGLDTLFTPNWAALADPGVWAAAYGQIFFSLSVAFGIMVTYSSYLKKKTDLTGSGFVVAFANSGFEILAGIAVFSALGFMAQASGVAVADVVQSGVGLAFIGFPTLISAAPGGQIIGVLFFASLVFAGLTSMISIMEVVISAVQDKLGLGRKSATLAIGIPMALLSVLLFATTSGLNVLDITDEFVNKFGILAGGLASIVVVSLLYRKLPLLAGHINRRSSIRVGKLWMVLVAAVAPIVLLYLTINEIITKLREPYGDFDPGFVGVFGWGMAGLLIVAAVILSLTPWRGGTELGDHQYDEERTADDAAVAAGTEAGR